MNSLNLLDLRNKPCPEPVLEIKKFLNTFPQSQQLCAYVSDELNVKNIEKFCLNNNYKFSYEPQNDFYSIKIVSLPKEVTLLDNVENQNIIFITTNSLGNQDDDFARNLMDLFLQSLLQANSRPKSVLLMYTGVKLLDPNSSTRMVLNEMIKLEIEVLACGLCLDYFGLKQSVDSDLITSMPVIVDKLLNASKVIKI